MVIHHPSETGHREGEWRIPPVMWRVVVPERGERANNANTTKIYLFIAYKGLKKALVRSKEKKTLFIHSSHHTSQFVISRFPSVEKGGGTLDMSFFLYLYTHNRRRGHTAHGTRHGPIYSIWSSCVGAPDPDRIDPCSNGPFFETNRFGW